MSLVECVLPPATNLRNQVIQCTTHRVMRGLKIGATARRSKGGSLTSTAVTSIGFSVSSTPSTGISSNVLPLFGRFRGAAGKALYLAIATTKSIASVCYQSIAAGSWSDWIELYDLFTGNTSDKLWGRSPAGGALEYEMRVVRKPA